MIAFLVFVTVLGYGFPAASPGEDLLKNRLITLGWALLLAPPAITGMVCPPTRLVRGPSTPATSTPPRRVR